MKPRKRIDAVEAAAISLMSSTPMRERQALFDRIKDAIKTPTAIEMMSELLPPPPVPAAGEEVGTQAR